MNNFILTEEKNEIGIITLNNPKKLNSLNIEMINSMTSILKTWEEDDRIKIVFLKGSGEKAFCAGGDVVSLYKAMNKDREKAEEFFTQEYKLDHYFHQFKKPIICLARGITMGGGIGIMNGCSHRVVTETTKMAMPEITIGLFPDVGASYFLNNIPEKIGLFLGLCGARFNGNDALHLKMADYFINDIDSKALYEEILNTNWSSNNEENYNISTRVLKTFNDKAKPNRPEKNIHPNQEEISKLTQFKNISDLDSFWQNYESKSHWINQSLQIYRSGSPTSAGVIFKQLSTEHNLSLEEAFKQELTMAKQFTKHHDFKEGIRALLIDKDGAPNWSPEKISSISNDLINIHFKD